MTKSMLTRALRRALVLSLAAPPLAGQVACGGDVVVDGAGTGTGTGVGCMVLSTTPTIVGQGGCNESFTLAGTPEDCGVDAGAQLSTQQCQALCPPSMFQMKQAMSCGLSAVPGGTSLDCLYAICGTGRRPPGLAPAAGGDGPDPIARFLAGVAHMEAASVVAFDQLAGELADHGAPDTLVRAARRSARDEVRHARVTRRFAERAGVCPAPVSVAGAPGPRTLEAIAADNAVEGCVRETFGAMVAMRQARAARDPGFCRAMETIARDEKRHAELSWQLAGWLDGKLDAAARGRVRRARDRAVDELLRELGAEPHPSLVAELGLPTAAQARAAVEDLRAALWASAA